MAIILRAYWCAGIMSLRFLSISCSTIVSLGIYPAIALAIAAPNSAVQEQLSDTHPQLGSANPNQQSSPHRSEVTAIPSTVPKERPKPFPQFTSTPATAIATAETLAIAPSSSTNISVDSTTSPYPPIPLSAVRLASMAGSAELLKPDGLAEPSAHTEASSLSPILAQVDPSQDRFPSNPALPEPLPEEVPADPPPPLETAPPDDTTPFFVTDIEVTGSTLFDEATLDSIVAPYKNREVTLRELQAAADAITQRYLDGGYITSRAIVGPQTITEGVVEIQVIEGELEAIQVEGTTRLQDYVRARIALGGTRPLNQARVEDQLRLLRIDPMFDSVEASLRAGSGVGKSRLIVRVVEANTIGGSLFSDNYSPPAVGEVRFGARLEFRNLAGLGDTLFSSASVTSTEGSNVYEIGYQVPINPMNGTLLLRYAPNDFRITDPEQPAFELGTEGSTDIYEVSIRQPLIRTPRDEFALSLGYRYREGSTLIGGTITSDSRINVFSFGQDYVHRDVNGAWALQSQFRLGNEDRSDLGTDSENDFFSWRGQVQRVQRLGPDHLLILQGGLQFSPDSLPGSEQFFVGGGLSVRGYDQNQRFGDNGLRFSIEDQITVIRD